MIRFFFFFVPCGEPVSPYLTVSPSLAVRPSLASPTISCDGRVPGILQSSVRLRHLLGSTHWSNDAAPAAADRAATAAATAAAPAADMPVARAAARAVARAPARRGVAVMAAGDGGELYLDCSEANVAAALDEFRQKAPSMFGCHEAAAAIGLAARAKRKGQLSGRAVAVPQQRCGPEPDLRPISSGQRHSSAAGPPLAARAVVRSG